MALLARGESSDTQTRLLNIIRVQVEMVPSPDFKSNEDAERNVTCNHLCLPMCYQLHKLLKAN